MAKQKKFVPPARCWSKIGVWGTELPRCPRLDEFIHCQNCDVFHAASLTAYERAIPDDYRLEWTEVLAGNKQAIVTDARTVVVFRLGDEWVAISTGLCKEISRMMRIHRLPHNKSHVLKGVVNNGGEIRICFSLGNLLGIAKAEQIFGDDFHAVYARMIVMDVAGRNYVFPVSEIKGLLQYREVDLGPLPETISASSASYMNGVIKWGDTVIGCLDEAILTAQLERSIR
jgi:chemotaxis-related protein WspD